MVATALQRLVRRPVEFPSISRFFPAAAAGTVGGGGGGGGGGQISILIFPPAFFFPLSRPEPPFPPSVPASSFLFFIKWRTGCETRPDGNNRKGDNSPPVRVEISRVSSPRDLSVPCDRSFARSIKTGRKIWIFTLSSFDLRLLIFLYCWYFLLMFNLLTDDSIYLLISKLFKLE